MMIKITKNLIDKNFSKRDNNNIKYIVIHDTANPNKGSNAEAHFKYFNSKNLDASAHFFVDDGKILQIVEEYNRAWHCGDGKGKNKITNDNSIGVEMCINSDGDFEKTIENTIKLSTYLLDKYNLDINCLVRHFDASGKICPNEFYENNWGKWNDFKNKVKFNLDILITPFDKNKIDYYVNGIYKLILEREPDGEGFNYWTNRVKNKKDLKDFINTVIDSKEYDLIINKLNTNKV